jgi:Putative bacterial sensory transduction regulator
MAISACSGPDPRVKMRLRICRGRLRMRFLTRAILIVAVVAFATAASAQGPRPGGSPRPGGGGGGGGGGGNAPGATVNGFNPDQIAQLFNAAGFKSQVVENNKSKMVQTLFWPEANDIFSGAFGIYCNDKGQQCGGMTTFANLGKVDAADAAWLNAWNSRYYFVRAYVTKDGNLIFDWDTLLANVSPDDIVLTAKLFKQIVDQSSDFKP